MAKVHNIGKQHFVQLIDFPVKWGLKLVVRGWTQEIEEPFRTAKPFIIRLRNHKAFVVGKWTGVQPDEETALNRAIEGRILSDEDFEEGWEAPAYQAPEEDFWAANS
jgi:hypothetical protein